MTPVSLHFKNWFKCSVLGDDDFLRNFKSIPFYLYYVSPRFRPSYSVIRPLILQKFIYLSLAFHSFSQSQFQKYVLGLITVLVSIRPTARETRFSYGSVCCLKLSVTDFQVRPGSTGL